MVAHCRLCSTRVDFWFPAALVRFVRVLLRFAKEEEEFGGQRRKLDGRWSRIEDVLRFNFVSQLHRLGERRRRRCCVPVRGAADRRDAQAAGSEEEEEGLLCNFILLRGPSAKKGGALYLSLLSFNMMFSFLAKKMG